MSLWAVGFAGICKALLMVLFTVTFLLLFLCMWSLTPISFGNWLYGCTPMGGWGCCKKNLYGKLSLSLLKWSSFLVAQGKRENQEVFFSSSRRKGYSSPLLPGLWHSCVERIGWELVFIFSYLWLFQRVEGNLWTCWETFNARDWWAHFHSSWL